MKKFRNILAMLMVFVMLVAVMPMNVFAADPAPTPAEHKITIADTTNGTVKANPASAAKDAEVTLTVTPAEGYELDKLTVAGKTATNVTVTDNKFTMPDEDVTVTATFKEKEKPKPAEHKITIAETTNGTVKANLASAAKDAEVTLTVTPAEGYELDKLTVAGKTATNVTVTDNKFTMPDEDVTVTATFKKKTEPKPETKEYTISKGYTNHGSFTVSPTLAKEKQTITVTAKPNYGYAVKNVYYIDDNNIKHSIKNYAYNDYYYYGYNGRYYNDYNYYYSDYRNYYYNDYATYEDYLKDRHYSFWKNNYRYGDYDYKYYNKYYDRYYDDYYRYYDDYVDNYYRRYSSYEDYLYDKHYSHYRDYRYYDKYDYRYYNYTTTDTFEMPASDVTVYVEFTDWSYYGYYYDDYYYYRYHRDKKDKEKEEKAEEEKVVEKTPQVYEASATINVGSNVFTKVNKNVTTTHQMDVAAYVKNGRVMLPLRYVAEALGLQVSWVPQTKTVIIWDLTQKVEIPIKSNKMIVNGVTYTSDVKPEIKNSRTMLPIANIARALGLIDGSDIIWDPVMKQVKLTRRVISK